MSTRKYASDFDGMTEEEYEDYSRKHHPEWFDENGNRLPTAISGARGPGGKYIPIKTRAERGIKGSPEEQGSNIPVGWKRSITEPVPVVRCTHTKRDGNRCNRWSVRGITVCIVHGGKSPTMQKQAATIVEAARLKILGLADEAVDVLDDLIKPGTNDAIRLKAAQDILDRAGIKGTIDVNVEVTDKTTARDTVLARLDKLKSVEEIESGYDDIEDAEVVDDGDS
jgi:hypothetical protein